MTSLGRRRIGLLPSRRSAAIAAIAVGAYAVAVLILLPRFGPGVMIVAFAPVVTIAATLGATAGVIVVVIMAGLTSLLWDLTGTVPGEAIVRVGSGIGLVIGIPLAWVIGRLRDTRQELAREHAALRNAITRQQEDIRDVVRELTTPLTAIGLTAGRAAADDGEPTARERARAIAEEAAMALELLRKLSRAAEIESDLPLARERVDLLSLARQTLASFDARGRRMVLALPPGAPLTVRGDHVALERVLRELLNNAVLYSREGPIALQVAVPDEQKVVRLTVHDGGPAIATGERSHLFRKFMRLSTAGGTSGAGLGLWLSRLIVEAHGGQLEASWPGDGNVFAMTLPLAADEGSAQGA